MKRATYFKKADAIYDGIISKQKEIRSKCETYIKKFLAERGGSADFTGCEEMVTVTYDGGNHPEYASNAFSLVEGAYLDKYGEIKLQTEDCSEYPIQNINWDEVYDVAAFIYENLDK